MIKKQRRKKRLRYKKYDKKAKKCRGKAEDLTSRELFKPLELQGYIPTNPLDSYEFTLRKTQWLGMFSLKFYAYQYYKDDFQNEGQANRFGFVNLFMENLCNRLFRIKNSKAKWVACEEFGRSGLGHIHIILSFDHLETGKLGKIIPKIDFSEENGEFFQKARESAEFLWRESGKNPKTIDVDWSPMFHNDGLVNYFTEYEDGRSEKDFIFSKYWEIHKGLIAA